MASVMMWWGSSYAYGDTLEHGVYAQFGPNGLELRGGVEGPGCGMFNCGREHTYFYLLATYHLAPHRMPEGGCKFESRPVTNFRGWVSGSTDHGALTGDDPDAKFGYRLRQYVYQDGVLIGMTEQKNPRKINIEGEEDEYDSFTLPETRTHPAFTWFLDKEKTLEIDVEIRFSLNVEGTGRLNFHGLGYDIVPMPWDPPFSMTTPQWSIQSVD